MSTLKYRMAPEGEYLRIQALKPIPNLGIRAGDLGGRIRSEHNLSQHGYGWVFPDAVVEEHAFVDYDGVAVGGTHLLGTSCVYGGAVVTDAVLDSCDISQNSVISGDCRLASTNVRRSLLKGRGRVKKCLIYSTTLSGAYTLENVSLLGIQSGARFTLTTPCTLTGNSSLGFLSAKLRAGLVEAVAFREKHDLKWEYGRYRGIDTDTLFQVLPRVRGSDARKLCREVLMTAYQMMPRDEFKALRKEVQKYEI